MELIILIYTIYKICDDLLEDFNDNEQIKEKIVELKETYEYYVGGSLYYDSECEYYFKRFRELYDLIEPHRYNNYELIKKINLEVRYYLMRDVEQ